MPRREVMPETEAVDVQGLRATGIPPGMEGQIGQEEVPATAQEEGQLEQAITKMMRMVHGRQSRDATIDAINNHQVPVHEAVGRQAAVIVATIKEQADAAGVKLDDEVLLNLGQHTVNELLEVGMAGRFFPFEDGSPQHIEVFKLSMLEGVKVHGEQVLRGQDAKRLTDEAGSYWAQQIAREVDEGTADPEFLAMMKGPGTRGGIRNGVEEVPDFSGPITPTNPSGYTGTTEYRTRRRAGEPAGSRRLLLEEE